MDSGFPVAESELLVVLLPSGSRGILTVCSALLAAELDILYTYPLLAHRDGKAALAIYTDDLQTAADLLRQKRFTVLSESDLGTGF